MDGGHNVMVFHRGIHHTDLDPDVPHIHGDTISIVGHVTELLEFSPDAVIDTSQFRADTTQSVISVIQEFPCKYVLVSSKDVYRGYGVIHRTESGPLQPMPLSEESELRTGPSFDQTETEDNIFAERAALGQDVISTTIVRAPGIFGPGDRQHRIGKVVDALNDSDGRVVLANDWASFRWGYGYVDEVADSLLLCSSDSRPGNHVYNVGYPTGTSTIELYGIVGEIIGWHGTIEVSDEEPSGSSNYSQHLYSLSSRIREELGYSETVSFEDAIKLTIGNEAPE